MLLLMACFVLIASCDGIALDVSTRRDLLQVATASLLVKQPQTENGSWSGTADASLTSIIHPFIYSESWTGTALPLLGLSEASAHSSWPMARWPDPLLRHAADPVDASWFGTDEFRKVCRLLEGTARSNQAVGLAAQQCGVNARLVSLEMPGSTNHRPQFLTMANPRIVQRTPEALLRVWREHCLVLPPTVEATVLRDARVVVQYQQPTNGSWRRVRLSGELARAAQHELDHDRGILVTDHLDLAELESDVMRRIEAPGHGERVALAYARDVNEWMDE